MITEQLSITCTKGHKTITTDRNTTHCSTCNEKITMGWKVRHHANLIDQETKNRNMNRVLEKYPNIFFHPGIVEPGYDNKPALADNWNDYPHNFTDWLEKYFDIKILWPDEWSYCCECYKAIRTKPDSYQWQPYYLWVSDCDLVCIDCLKDDPQDAIEYYLNSTNRVMPADMIEPIEKNGFTCLESENEGCPIYETGFHPGQNDHPINIAKWIEKNLPEHDYLFVINENSQFYCRWSVWVRPKNYEN